MRAVWTVSGTCISGSTGRRSAATKKESGGAVMTNTRRGAEFIAARSFRRLGPGTWRAIGGGVRLKKLDEVAGRIFQQDLFAAHSLDGLVAKAQAGFFESR